MKYYRRYNHPVDDEPRGWHEITHREAINLCVINHNIPPLEVVERARSGDIFQTPKSLIIGVISGKERDDKERNN